MAVFQSLSSAVHKVGELPAPVDTPEPCAVAIVIERFVGELRWRYHETALLHEFLRQDAVQLRPEILLVPVLKDTFPGFLRIQAVTKVRGHHFSQRVHIVSRNRFAQAADKSLKINIAAFLALLGFRFLLERRLLFFLLLRRRLAAA